MNHLQFQHAKELRDKLNKAVADYQGFVEGMKQEHSSASITLSYFGTKTYSFAISRAQASAIVADEISRLKEKMEKAKKDFEDYMPT